MKNEVFEQNPQLKKCFGTSDGELFYTEDDAKNHSKSLDDKSVETISNENFLKVVESEDLSDEAIKMAEFEDEKRASQLAEKEAIKMAEFEGEKEASQLAEKEAIEGAEKETVKTDAKKVTPKSAK